MPNIYKEPETLKGVSPYGNINPAYFDSILNSMKIAEFT